MSAGRDPRLRRVDAATHSAGRAASRVRETIVAQTGIPEGTETRGTRFFPVGHDKSGARILSVFLSVSGWRSH